MPDFEPVTTIRQIRTRYPAVKVLVVSAYDDDVYVQGLLGAGVNGYHQHSSIAETGRQGLLKLIDALAGLPQPPRHIVPPK